jgi:hypothetical protein
MSTHDEVPEGLSITTYIEEGATIAAILFVWGILAAVAALGIGNLGGPGSMLGPIGIWLAYILGLVGLLNAVLYVIWRGVDYHRTE